MTLTTPDSRSMICLHATELCNNGYTDRDAVCQADSCGPNEPCFRFGPYLSREIVQIFMFPAHGKVLGGCTLYTAVCSKGIISAAANCSGLVWPVSR